MKRSLLLQLPLLCALLPTAADARPVVQVRSGEHAGMSRVVFEWPRPVGYRAEEAADRVRVRFAEPGDYDIAALRQPLRNLSRVEAAGDTATLERAPGTQLRHFRLGGRVVVDLVDPSREQAHAGLLQLVSADAPASPAQRLAAQGSATQGLGQMPALPARRPPISSPALAQAPAAPPPAAAAAPPGAPTPIRLEAGTGRLLGLPSPAATVMAADPRIARVQPSSPTSVFVMAVANGRTTVIATDDLGRPVAEFDVTVFGQRVEPGPGGNGAATPAATPAPRPLNAGAIESQIRTLLGAPGQVRVRAAGRSLVLSGTVATPAEARRAESIARGMANDDTQIVNELAVLSSIQVNLRVRVAEISRDVTRQFGINWAAIGSPGNFVFGLVSGAAANTVLGAVTPGAGGGGTLSTPQRIGAGFRTRNWDINGIIDALAADQLVTILAEPNLTAQSGEVASFLAGGEFPIPVAARDNTVTIEFKPFGVSLAFVPVVQSNDRLTLRVRPEVSELSDQGAISVPTLTGTLRIPALSVRRAETTVELGSGQSFAIAGLLQRNSTQIQDGINGLTDLPVLGPLFRSDRFQRRETELVIIVTPYLVQPVSDPGALAAPTDGFRPATSLERILRQRQLSSGGPAVPALSPELGFRID